MTASRRARNLCVVAALAALVAAPVRAIAPQLPDIDRASVERVIRVLADDDMEGRSAFSPAAMRAAAFIAEEFADIGLEQVPGSEGYLQRFTAALRARGRGGRGGRGGGGGGAAGGGAAPAEEYELANVVGMISGNRSEEFVLFSAHYDHIGIRPGGEDMIANGANDNASGTTAVIELARYFKGRPKPERTLLFVAFTAEERGGFGSRHFSEQLDPDQIVAMFNIEMIGKPAVSGPNTAWITGFERSSFGEILQQAVEGTPYEFYADPYPDQNLFLRSDNATLARLGVPAHTISTTPIDVDPDYHQVTDHVETLDLDHMTDTIRAIAMAGATIVSGEATPTRVDPDSVRRRQDASVLLKLILSPEFEGRLG
ncbi:MAG: M20/M25/M40 family metallo-hydrolase [Acidobacteria bacterium]|nr:M20/M25/M40 family metallo-hydrolase [Acidobacteriota bacterium]